MNWTQILQNKAQYPDDLKFAINGQEVSLGEIRRQNDASRGELEQRLSARQQELEQTARQQQLATDNLARVVENVQRVTGLSVEDIVAGRIPENLRGSVAAATAATVTNSGVSLRDDPLYRPMFEALAPIERDLGTVRQALGASINAYKNDRARLDYLEFMATRRPSDKFAPKFEEAVNIAVQKGYKNNLGFPDVTRAMEELAEPVRAQASQEDVRRQAFEEGRRAALAEQAAAIGQPAFGGPSSAVAGAEFATAQEANKGSHVATIREQLNRAFADPAMLTQAVQ